MGDVKDFDQAWAEKDNETIEFKARGEQYELPPSIPASIMFDAISLKKKYGDEEEIPDEKTMEIAKKMLGEEQVDAMCDDGLTADELGDIIIWANKQYTPEGELEDEEAGSGKAEAGNE